MEDQLSRPVLKTQTRSDKETDTFLDLTKDDFSECQMKQSKWKEAIEHL